MFGRIKQIPDDFVVEEMPKKEFPLHASGKEKKYTIFWMEKKNRETHEVLREISKSLKISEDKIFIAGTKDKLALTRQRICILGTEPEKINALEIKDAKFSGIEKTDKKLNLGDFEGNKFTITIRNIGLEEEQIRNIIEKKAGREFLNLFGPQRFGSANHLVGKCLVKKDYKKAVGIFLGTRKIHVIKAQDNRNEVLLDVQPTLNRLKSQNFQDCIKANPHTLYWKKGNGKWERFVSNYLEKHPNDFANAFRPLPYRLKKIFINSYQSYIWNKTANIIEKLVKRNAENISIPIIGFDSEKHKLWNNIKCFSHIANSSKSSKINEICYDTKISSNLIGKTIKNIMKIEKVNFADFEIKDLSIKSNGSERKLFAKPDQFKIIEIADDELNLGKKKAVISFILPPGSYATVFLKTLGIKT